MTTKKTDWASRFQKHSELGVEFGLPKRSATAGFGSDFQSPDRDEVLPDLRDVLPPKMVRHPDYDLFGGAPVLGATAGDVVLGKLSSRSGFGLGVVIPSTALPPKPFTPAPPSVPTPDDGKGGGTDFGFAAPSGGWVKTLLAGIGLFFVGLFIDQAVAKRLGPHHKPIVIFKR